MSEWWTYRLSDFLLFSPKTYYRLFELYNQAVWPGQVVALLAGLIVVILILRPRAWAGRAVAAILAAGWLCVAWGYHHRFYATINWAADNLAVAFTLQALLLFGFATLGNRLCLDGAGTRRRAIGSAILLFAVAVEPLVGPLLGRSWRGVELFALAPDPTVIGTLGVLVAAERGHWLLWVVPLAWCLVSGATLWTMEAADAWILPVIGMTAVFARRAQGTFRSD